MMHQLALFQSWQYPPQYPQPPYPAGVYSIPPPAPHPFGAPPSTGYSRGVAPPAPYPTGAAPPIPPWSYGASSGQASRPVHVLPQVVSQSSCD